jgi:FkbM family methyltransferase
VQARPSIKNEQLLINFKNRAMYNTNVLQNMYSNKLFAAGIKFYELFKLAVKPSIYKDNNSKEYLPFIEKAVIKGYTVLDIGSHKRSYFFDLFKIAKLPGRMIAFETSPGIYSYLQRMKQLLNLDNIVIEQSFDRKASLDGGNDNNTSAKDKVTSATIIDFKARINVPEKGRASLDTVDHYCSVNFIIPALIKFKVEGNDLAVLLGAKDTMQKYKPQILIECSEGKVSPDTLIAAFKLLSELNYSGYFILDTIKVPLANFDFNTYQNEVLGFYCNNFFFE